MIFRSNVPLLFFLLVFSIINGQIKDSSYFKNAIESNIELLQKFPDSVQTIFERLQREAKMYGQEKHEYAVLLAIGSCHFSKNEFEKAREIYDSVVTLSKTKYKKYVPKHYTT